MRKCPVFGAKVSTSQQVLWCRAEAAAIEAASAKSAWFQSFGTLPQYSTNKPTPTDAAVVHVVLEVMLLCDPG